MEISISSPSLRSRASTTTAGRRTAKLLPHLETCIKDIPKLLCIHTRWQATRLSERAAGSRGRDPRLIRHEFYEPWLGEELCEVVFSSHVKERLDFCPFYRPEVIRIPVGFELRKQNRCGRGGYGSEPTQPRDARPQQWVVGFAWSARRGFTCAGLDEFEKVGEAGGALVRQAGQ